MDERIIVYQARHAIYTLLQRLYQNIPDEALLGWLNSERPFAEFPIVLDDAGAAALQQVEDALRQASLDALCDDYTQLYVGPGRMNVPPWESVYRGEERLIFDQHTLQVREFYSRHGMESVKKNQVPEDSMAIELEFMRVLSERLLKTTDAADMRAERILLEEQLAFLNQHLLVWAPDFVSLSLKHAQTDFYRGLAGVLHSFLNWDQQLLEQLLDLVKPA